MSARNLDKHNRFRCITVGFRVSPEEHEHINKAVAMSGLSKQEYCYRRCLGRDIVVQNEKISVLVVEPEKKPYAKEISSGLSSLQHEVGGYIQAVYPYEEPVAIICDEEAKLKGSELNRVLRDEDGHIYDVVAGTFLIVGLGESEFTSLTPEHMKQFKEKFDTPEMFMRINGKLVVLPMEDERAKAKKPSVLQKLKDAKADLPKKSPGKAKEAEL